MPCESFPVAAVLRTTLVVVGLGHYRQPAVRLRVSIAPEYDCQCPRRAADPRPRSLTENTSETVALASKSQVVLLGIPQTYYHGAVCALSTCVSGSALTTEGSAGKTDTRADLPREISWET